MATIFLTNLGVRDIRLAGQYLERPRQDGDRLLREWPDVADQLSLPIVEPTVRYLRDRGSTPDRVVLFATDQPDTAASRDRDRDTVHFAELAKRLLEKRLELGGRVIVRRIGHGNPALYDEMYRFFARVIGNRADKTFQDVRHCYISPVGGTPAANTGLLLAGVEHFGKDCTVLYLREGTDVPVGLDVGRLLYVSTLRQVAAQQIESYQFAASLPLLRELELPRESCCLELAEYCQRRLNFDFGRARRVVEDAYSRAQPDTRGLLDQATTEARHLDEATDAGPLLVELAHNMDVAYRNGAYVDYLARVVRFEEAAARFVVETSLPPLSYARNDYEAQAARRKQIAEIPDLLDYLGTISIHGQPIRYEQSNAKVLLALVDYVVSERANRPIEWVPPAQRRQELAEAQQTLRRLEGLNRQRNASVHQFGGASAEQIARLYEEAAGEPRDLRADIWRTVELVVGQAPGEWLVDQAKAKISAELQT